jgi:hypothetical protein
MLIEFGTEWALNQSNEFKVINSLSTLRPKTKAKHVGTLLEQCWRFVPCITIKENEGIYAFNKKLVPHGAKN